MGPFAVPGVRLADGAAALHTDRGAINRFACSATGSAKRYLAIFLLVSSRQNFLSFSFLHFLCIFSEDDATFGKDISRPNRSFFLISFKKILRKQKRLARILLHEKRRKREKYAEK